MKFTIIIPTYNEEEIIEKSITQVEKFIQKYSSCGNIIITDGCSKDKTVKKIKKLQKRFVNLKLIENNKHTGKGNDIEKAIKKSNSSFCIFMDADLSTDLTYLPKLISYLEEGYELVIGSRLLKKSKVKRSFIREVLAKGYSLMIRILFRIPINDYQCGFKGFNRTKIFPILKETGNKKWFWDTEILIRSYKNGLNIKEFPVNWKEQDRKSKLNTFKVITEMLLSAIILKLKLLAKNKQI